MEALVVLQFVVSRNDAKWNNRNWPCVPHPSTNVYSSTVTYPSVSHRISVLLRPCKDNSQTDMKCFAVRQCPLVNYRRCVVRCFVNVRPISRENINGDNENNNDYPRTNLATAVFRVCFLDFLDWKWAVWEPDIIHQKFCPLHPNFPSFIHRIWLVFPSSDLDE